MKLPIEYLTHDHPYHTPYYDVRYNHTIAFMSDKPLGLQALVNFIDGSFVWINIPGERIP